MPLNRPALSLGAGPRGVQDARRWVVGAFNELSRDDLAECAEMGVSELVTNALLHGEGPIEVRVRGTREHPRVEVRDASTDPPLLPTEETEDDEDVLLTFGRGLSIVARASDAWGADIEVDGKIVWFAPAHEFSEDDGPEGVVTGVGRSTEGTGELPTDLMDVLLPGLAVRDYVTFQRHFRELRREVRLLALAHEADYPLAKDLSDVFGSIARPLRLDQGSPEVTKAQQAGLPHLDLHLVMSRTGAQSLGRFVELLELVDAFAREEKMLALARTTEQRDFENWFLGEFIRQAAGSTPRAWSGAGSGATSAPRSICS